MTGVTAPILLALTLFAVVNAAAAAIFARRAWKAAADSSEKLQQIQAKLGSGGTK